VGENQTTPARKVRRLAFSSKVYWSIAGAAFLFCCIFWEFGQFGNDWLAVLSVVCFCIAVRHVFKGYTSLDQRQDEQELKDLVLNPTDTDGKAKWATANDIKQAGMDKSTGLFLGSFKGQNVYYPGETHLLTIAPPGAGKGTSIVIPNLLTYSGSVIVTDPKGELFAITARHRQNKLGHKIIVLCPWAKKLSAELGIEIPDHGFNPLSIIQPGSDIKDEAELISSLLLPGNASMKADDEFWLEGGQSILTAFMLHLKSQEETVGTLTLPLVRQYLHLPPEELTAVLFAMSKNENFGGSIREYGGKLLGTAERSPKQFEGLLGTAQKALRIYDSVSPLGAHVSEGEIDFKALKTQPTTIYLIMPSDRATTHAPWLNLVMSLAIELVGRDRSNRRVLFLLDEMANLGYMPNILRGMAQYRGQGVQVWSIIQQLSQLERLYGKPGSTQFVGTCELINIFGVWDPETIQFVSQWLGQSTVRNYSYNVSKMDNPGDFADVNYSTTDKALMMMRPEDVRGMSANEQLIFYRNLAPIKAEKVHYHTHAQWKEWAEPNPYRR
jgi:type IV secretion system protein VirD4